MIRWFAVLTRCVAPIVVVALFHQPALADDVAADVPKADAGFRLNFEGHLGPANAAAQQIQAEAAYLRAYGEMQKDLAEARIRHAEARRLEGQNAKQAVRDQIEIRDIQQADRDKRIGEKLANVHKVNSRKWEQISNLPELNYSQVETGKGLNFLIDRLSTTFVTFRSESMGSQQAALAVAAKLTMPKGTVHSLRVRQKLSGGEALIFRLDEGQPLQDEWWPPVLRSPELRAARKEFKDARAAVFTGDAVKTEDDHYKAMRRLIASRQALEDDFLREQDRSIRLKNGDAFRMYQEGKAFLKTLDAEIRRLNSVGPGGSFSQSLLFNGSFLPDLLAHMVRNGLEFAPARKGEEQAYQQIFHMLRDLFKAVEFDANPAPPSTSAVIPDEPKRFPLGNPAK